MDIIANHRSIRKYSKKEISNELIRELIEKAERTQTMGNLQLYSVIITRSAEMKKKLSPLHFNQPMVESAQAIITICADFNRTTKWCECRNAKPGYDNELSFMNAAIDALLFTQTFSILCEEKGIGLCFLGTTIYRPDKIIELLKLPKLTFPISTLTLGYPEEIPAMSDRLPVDAIIHEETYKDYTPQSIDKLYGLKESLPENKEFVKINNKENLAQIYTDIRYTRKDNEAMSETIKATLKKQGFMK
mgnify:CR=1 FL=1